MFRCFKKKLRNPGIEPGPPAWQARILPLDQLRLINGDWPAPLTRLQEAFHELSRITMDSKKRVDTESRQFMQHSRYLMRRTGLELTAPSPPQMPSTWRGRIAFPTLQRKRVTQFVSSRVFVWAGVFDAGWWGAGSAQCFMTWEQRAPRGASALGWLLAGSKPMQA
jgi:hypothetical protein